MLTGISKEKALQKAVKGNDVFVVDRNIKDSAGNTPMIPFMNYLRGLDFLVDVPAVPDMVSQSKESDGGNVPEDVEEQEETFPPPTKSRKKVR